MFDHPTNALSLARTHQRELLQREQMDQLARKVASKRRGTPDWVVGVVHWCVPLINRTRGIRNLLSKRARFQPSASSLMGLTRGHSRNLLPGVEQPASPRGALGKGREPLSSGLLSKE